MGGGLMKNLLLSMLIILVTACNGGKGGGGGAAAPVLDAKLFEGSATWEASYIINGGTWDDEIQFVGDELHRTLYKHTPGGTLGPIDSSFRLIPLTNASFQSIDLSDDSTGIWTYTITGNVFRLCDSVGDCIEFTKQ
jgi:hypothetical protein